VVDALAWIPSRRERPHDLGSHPEWALNCRQGHLDLAGLGEPPGKDTDSPLRLISPVCPCKGGMESPATRPRHRTVERHPDRHVPEPAQTGDETSQGLGLLSRDLHEGNAMRDPSVTSPARPAQTTSASIQRRR